MPKATEVPSSALSTEVLPAYLTESTEGREQIDQNDLTMPRLQVINALSKKFKDKTAGLGDLVDSVAANVLYVQGSKPLTGVFLAVRKARTRWHGKGADGKIECHSPDGLKALMPGGMYKGNPTNDCSLCEHSQFVKMPGGETKAPACTEAREFLFLAEDYPMPLILTFSKSASKQGKELVSKLNADMAMTGRPIYAFRYELSTKLFSGNGNEWYGVTFKSSKFPSEDEFLRAKAQYKAFNGALKKQDFRQQEREDVLTVDAADPNAPPV